MNHRALSIAVSVVALIAAGAQDSTRAQSKHWDRGFGLPGADTGIRALYAFDDGNAPALYAGMIRIVRAMS